MLLDVMQAGHDPANKDNTREQIQHKRNVFDELKTEMELYIWAF